MQLPLNIRLSDAYCFENFLGSRNEEAMGTLVTAIESLSQDGGNYCKSVYLWGLAGTGKTHLLQAACQRARALGLDSVYLPLTAPDITNPAIIEGMDQVSLVCIDDLQSVAGQEAWEMQLFSLYERIQGKGLLVMASSFAPPAGGFQLADLVSRFNKGLVYGLHSLSHAERLNVVRQRAKIRGFELSDEVAGYIEKHLPRDLASLVGLLDRLDQASLIQQRKITVPFLRSLLESDGKS